MYTMLWLDSKIPNCSTICFLLAFDKPTFNPISDFVLSVQKDSLLIQLRTLIAELLITNRETKTVDPSNIILATIPKYHFSIYC
ncbi:unnamed protein product [Adineta ricciae]|uniref:Uncharacterized protein n=1 Tax=Adineta ricciae TaxID=249248 RepID=A0A816HJQ7_ADIRI|nr:unnamed protein product [Adineta ricciae]